jgi:hypothetical protein
MGSGRETSQIAPVVSPCGREAANRVDRSGVIKVPRSQERLSCTVGVRAGTRLTSGPAIRMKSVR